MHGYGTDNTIHIIGRKSTCVIFRITLLPIYYLFIDEAEWRLGGSTVVLDTVGVLTVLLME